MPLESLEGLRDVRSVKQFLHKEHGLPPRFRQRLLLGGGSLEDGVEVDASMNMQLVLLAFSDTSLVQAAQMNWFAEIGATKEVEALLQLPQDPDLACLTLRSQLEPFDNVFSKSSGAAFTRCFSYHLPLYYMFRPQRLVLTRIVGL